MYPNDFEPRVGHPFTFRMPANPKATAGTRAQPMNTEIVIDRNRYAVGCRHFF
jgi:hypothetical protein